MTLIVGILCHGGVVMASDSAATYGALGTPTIGQQECRKVHKLSDNILYASTGSIGMSQVISDTLKRAWQDKKFKDAMSPEHFMDMVGKTISQTVGPYLQTAALQQQLVRDASSSLCKSMCAFSYKESACLFQFDFNGAPESSSDELAFVAMGSGQNIADPFLAFLKRLLWQNTKPSLPEGRLAAVWTIDHVRLVNPGGVGGPIQLATLAPKDGKGTPIVTMFSDSDIQEHLQQVRDAEKALINELRGQSQELNESPLPKVPN